MGFHPKLASCSIHPKLNQQVLTISCAQVGDGDTDHYCWQRPEDMTTSRQAYKVDRDRPGSDVAGEMAAALAAASMVFRAADRAYSRRLLAAARDVMELVVRHQGKYSDFVGGDISAYYQSYSGYKVRIKSNLRDQPVIID